MRHLRIIIGNQEAKATLPLSDKKCEDFWNALPIKGELHYAKIVENEVFFITPIFLKLETQAPVIFEQGTIAYWPNRQMLCIYYGEEPLHLFGYFILGKIIENLEGIRREGEEVKYKQGKKAYVYRG